MPVVGHVFEAIDPDSSDFDIRPDYPTILVGAKHLTKSRLSDRVDEDRDIGNERFLDLEGAQERGFTAEEYEKMLLGPIRSYLEWCRDGGQTYMHTGLSSLSAYLYQRHQHALGIWKPTTLMNRVSFEGNFMPVGTLCTEAENFERLTLELTGKGEKLEVTV